MFEPRAHKHVCVYVFLGTQTVLYSVPTSWGGTRTTKRWWRCPFKVKPLLVKTSAYIHVCLVVSVLSLLYALELNMICAQFWFTHVQSHLRTRPAARLLSGVVVGVWFGAPTNCLVIMPLHGWPDGLFPFLVTSHKAGNQPGSPDAADTDAALTQISLSPLSGCAAGILQPWGT